MPERPLRAALLLAFLGLAAALALTPLSNNDIWLHLKTGDLILERWEIPRTEEYTFTRSGTPVVNHEWLAQAIFALTYMLGGLAALALLKLALTAGALAVIYAASVRAARGILKRAPGLAPLSAAIVTAAAAILLGSHLHLRPHLFTFILAGLFVWVLGREGRAGERERNGPGLGGFATLLILQVLWVNLHGGFIIGILLAGVWALAESIRRMDAVPGVALVPALAAVSLINPYGWRIYGLVGQFTEPAFREFIVEWQSPLREPFLFSALFWVYILWLTAAAVAAIELGRRGRFFPAAVAALFGLMSLLSKRHVSVLAVVTAPVLAAALAEVMEWLPALIRRLRSLLWSAAGCVALLALLVAGVGLPWPGGGWRRAGSGIGENIPVEAVEFLRREGLEGKLFSTMAFSSYATWAAWPDLKTFVDSRLEIFGGEFLRLYGRALESARDFRFVESNTRFDLALLSWRLRNVEGPVEAIGSDPGWSLVYFDDLALVYALNVPGREDLMEFGSYRALDPVRFLAGQGFAPEAPLDIVEDEARRAVEAATPLPGRPAMNGTAWLMLGTALQQQGRHSEAIDAFRSSLAARADTPVAYGLLAISLEAIGDGAGARAALEELRRRFPDSKFAREMMREMDRPD